MKLVVPLFLSTPRQLERGYHHAGNDNAIALALSIARDNTLVVFVRF